MKSLNGMRSSALIAAVLIVAGWGFVRAQTNGQAKPTEAPKPAMKSAPTGRLVPVFEYDETFPKPLPNHWITGTVVGIDVDAKQHVWIAHRAETLRPDELHGEADPPLGECCVRAPYVIEFDYDGNVVQAWGGPS